MRLAVFVVMAALLSACIEPSPTPSPSRTPGHYYVIGSSQQ
jgi:hypothetical protein